MLYTPVHWIECPGPGRLATMARPRGNDWLEDEVQALVQQEVDHLVSTLSTWEMRELGLVEEPALVEASGIAFVQFPIADGGVPESLLALQSQVEELTLAMGRGEGVVVHSRQGSGRASLVAAALLVTLDLEPEEAWARVAKARGEKVPDTDAQREWMGSYWEFRLASAL